MRTALLPLLLLLVPIVAPAEPLTTPTIQIVPNGQSGLAVRLSGVPVVRETAVALHTAGWKKSFYSSNGAWPHRVVSDDGKSVTVHHKPAPVSGGVSGDLTETATLTADDKVTFTLAGTIRVDAEADVRAEWTLGYLNAFPLYAATAEGDTHEPIVLAPHARTADGHATLISRTKELTLDGRLGLILVSTAADAPDDLSLNLMDGQVGQHAWSDDAPSYWLGVSDLKLPAGKRFTYSVTLQFAARTVTPGPVKLAIEPAARDVPIAYQPEAGEPLVIPGPRTFEPGLGTFPLNETTRIVIGDEAAVPAAGAFRREVAERFGWGLEMVAPQVAGKSTNVIALLPPTAPMAPEGYAIDASVNVIAVRASSPAGFSYGVATLGQLLRAGPSGARIPVCRVADEPAMGFRGLHLFVGPGEWENFRLLCERLIGPMKYNHVVLQCDRTEWDATPKLRGPRYVPKAEVQTWAAVARRNALEPIPLVNSLGHMDWLFGGGNYADLAEDPDHPWAYVAGNPATYALVDRIYDEAFALFDGPRLVHIGHDEVNERGRYPNRDASKRTGATRLFVDDVRHWVDHFRAKPARVMLWGDMMLANGEAPDAANASDPPDAAARRAGVPKDAIICDWHYQPPLAAPAAPAAGEYASLGTFKDAGFTTIACPNHDPANVFALARAARANGAWGVLQTTWETSGPSDAVLARAGRDLSAWVLAADYAWSGRTTPPDQLPYRPADVVSRLFGRAREPAGPAPGFTLDLSGSANVRLTGKTASADAWLGLADFAAAYAGAHADRFGGTAFELPKAPPDTAGAIMLGGTLAAAVRPMPREVSIKVARRAVWLDFLQTTAYPAAPAAAVAHYLITYDDGTKAAVSIRYGFEVRAWDDPAPCLAARVGWSGTTAASPTSARVPAAFHVMRWLNPNPDKAIASVTIVADHPYASLAILGVTGLTH